MTTLPREGGSAGVATYSLGSTDCDDEIRGPEAHAGSSSGRKYAFLPQYAVLEPFGTLI